MRSKASPRILIVNPYGIGDALFSSPFIRTLKKRHTDAFIGLMLGSRTKPLFEFNPDIDAIFIYDKEHLRSLSLWQRSVEIIKLMFTINRYRFDLLLDLSNTDEYAFCAKFIWNIPIRIGFQFKKRGRFLTHKVPLGRDFSHIHVVEHYYRLLEFMDVSPELFETRLSLHPDPKPQEWFRDVDERLICLLPGGGKSWGDKSYYKYWPTPHYLKLIDDLHKAFRVKIVLIGGPDDQPLCDALAKKSPHPLINLAGQTTLRQLIAVLARADLVIGTESGPLHMATALNRPLLALFGPADPISYGPFSRLNTQIAMRSSVPCSPCYQNFRVPDCSNRVCLKELSPETVFQKASFLLS